MEGEIFRIPPPISGGSGDEVDAPADVSAESSAAPDQAQPTPAGAQNTEQPGQNGSPQPREQMVPYSRLEKVSHQNQQFREALAQANGRLQQMETQLKQHAQANGGQVSQQDAQQYQDAWAAVERIFAASPRGQKLLQMADQAEEFQGVQSNVKSMQEAQLRAMERQSVNRVLELAKAEGLPQNEKFLKSLVRHVQAEALEIQNAKARFAGGDLTLMDEAFRNSTDFLSHVKREGQNQLLDTKQRTRNLPPASRGGAAGPPGLPKLDQDNPRAFTEALHKAAAQHLGSQG